MKKEKTHAFQIDPITGKSVFKHFPQNPKQTNKVGAVDVRSFVAGGAKSPKGNELPGGSNRFAGINKQIDKDNKMNVSNSKV
ncbi:MAG: hypothetical protein Q8N88_04315 [Nanoarchaeota archaeon]|nr:hypothetical protein [Nanoarchaeota archaeon]